MLLFGVVNMWLLLTPDRIRSLLPGLAISDILGLLLQSSWVLVGCYGLAIVVQGFVGLVQVCLSRGFPNDQLCLPFVFVLPFLFDFRKVSFLWWGE